MALNTSTFVLGLDLSKGSTGYAYGPLDLKTGEVRIDRIGTIKPHPAAKANRWQHRAVESVIINLAGAVSQEPWFSAGNFTVAIEANVWGESASEFQFYLGQEVLHWVNALGVDCCTYSPSTIKSFIKAFTPQPELITGGEKGKVEIERVWRLHLRPRCPAAFPNSVVETDDAVDGGWIALFGLYTQALAFALAAESISEVPFWHSVDPVRDLFLRNKIRQPFNVGELKMANIYTNLRGHQHLGVAGKGFFPFRQMEALRNKLVERYANDPHEVMLWVRDRVQGKRGDISWKACRDLLEKGDFHCGIRHTTGTLLLTP